MQTVSPRMVPAEHGQRQSVGILLAESQRLMRDTLSVAVENALPQARVDAVRSFAEAAEYLERRPATDMVLVDLTLPDMPGLHSLSGLRAIAPNARTVLLVHEGGRDMLKALRATGVHAAFSKDIGVVDLSRKLLRVLEGETLFDLPGPDAKVMALCQQHGLSYREAAVLRHYLLGSEPPEIARRFRITEATVRGHLKRVQARLGIRSNLEAYPAFRRLLWNSSSLSEARLATDR